MGLNKINLSLVVAPFQLLSAVENIDKSDGCEAWLMIRGTKHLGNIKQMMSIMDESEWDKVIYLNGKTEVLAFLVLLKWACLFKFKRIRVLALNVGEFRSRLCLWALRCIKSDYVGLLDDGVASLTLYSSEKNSIKSTSIEDLKNIDPILFQMSIRKKLILKSFLNLPESSHWSVQKYKFHNFNKLYDSPEYHISSKLVFFLGTKFVEGGYWDAEYYFELCKKVLAKFPGKDLVYIAHRGEMDDKLDELKKRLDINVLRPEKPIELHLLEMRNRPFHVVSFLSAALFTIPELFHDISVQFIKTNPDAYLKPVGGDEVSIKYLEGLKRVSVVDL